MHESVHDEGCTCHIAGVLHERDKEVENENLWQEDDDRPYSTDDAIDEHIVYRARGQGCSDEVAKPSYACINPIHRILTKHERHVEHQE